MASSKDTLARDLNEIANLLSSEQVQTDSILATSPVESPSVLDPLGNFNDKFDSLLLNKKAATIEAKKQAAKSILNKKRIEEEHRNRIEIGLRERAAAAFTPGLTRAEPSPVVEVRNEGRLRKHEDGTYTVTTLDGRTIPGLSEYDARTFSAWSDADIQGIRQDAPEGFVARKATGIARSVVDIGLQGSIAALGGTTLPEKVSSYNQLLKQREFAKDDSKLKDRLRLGIRGKETQDLLDKAKVPAKDAITQKEIDQYRTGILSSDNPKFAILQQLDAAAIESKESFDKFSKIAAGIKEKLPYNMRDQAVVREAYQVIAENEGNWAAMWHAATNYTGALLSQGIDSTPWMVAFTIGGPFAQTMILADLAKGRGRAAIEEFRTKYGKEPTMEEASRIKMWSAIGTVAEKFGDMAAVGLLTKRIPWINRIIDTASKSTTARIAGLVTLKIPGSLGGEAISGASTAASEQMALEGKITDPIAIGYDALAEAFGTPGGIATMYAGSAVTEAAKLPFKPSKTEQAIIDLDERIDKVKETTLSDLDDPAFHNQLKEGAEARDLNEKLALSERLLEKLEDPTPLEDTDKNFKETQLDDITAEFLKESLESKDKTGDQLSLFEEQKAREKAEATLEKETNKLKEEVKDIKDRLDTKLTEKEQSNYVKLLEKTKEAILTREKKQKTLKTKEGKEARIKEIDEEIDKIRNTPGFTGRKVKRLLDEKDTLQKELDPFITRVKRVFKTQPTKQQDELSYEPIEDKEFKDFIKSIDLKKITNPDTDPAEISEVIDRIAQLQKTRELSSFQEETLTRITDRILGTQPRSEEGTLGSIRNVTTKSETLLRKALETAKKDKNEADEALITAELDRRAEKKKLEELDKAEGKTGKTLQEVHTDIEEGVSTRWTGINTYYDRIVEIVAAAKDAVLDRAAVSNQLGRMKTHVDNLRKKRDKFQSAFKKGPRADGKIYVIRGTVGDNREMTYTEEVMTREEYLAERKNGKYVNAIITKGTKGFNYNSAKLIEKVEAEVAYGEKFLEVLTAFEGTSYERAEASLRLKREELRKKKEQLSKSKFKKKKALILDKETRDKIDSKTDDELRTYIKEQTNQLKKDKASKDKTKILQTEALISHASLQWNKRQQDKKKKGKKGKKKDSIIWKNIVGGVVRIIDDWKEAKKFAKENPDISVYTLRVNKGDTLPLGSNPKGLTSDKHFGNPWSADFFKGTPFNTKGDTQAAVKKYEDWLNLKDVYHKDISEKERKKLDDRRDWILEQIDGNLFDTRDLIYFKNTRLKSSDRSHADVLANRIAEKKSKSKEQDQSIPEDNQKLLEKIVELRWKRNKTNQDKKYLEKLLKARKERKFSLAFQMPIILKFLVEKFNPKAEKHIPKEQAKAQIATQFIGTGVEGSSSRLYEQMYEAEGLANTGEYTADDVVFVASNGRRAGAVNPVIFGEDESGEDDKLLDVYENLAKAMEAGASIVMDTKEHLSKTGYNIGEEALAKYLTRKGWKRVTAHEGLLPGVGMWTQETAEEKQESALTEEIKEELKKITLDNALGYLQDIQEILEKFNEQDSIPVSFRGIEFDQKRVAANIYDYIVEEVQLQFKNLYTNELTKPSMSYQTLVDELQNMQDNLFDITENYAAYIYYSEKWRRYYGLLSQNFSKNQKQEYLKSIGKTELSQLTKEERAKYNQISQYSVQIPKSPTGVFSRTIDLALEAEESPSKRLPDPRTDLQKSQEVLTKGIVERFGDVWTAIDWLIEHSLNKRTRYIAAFVKRTLPKKQEVTGFPIYFHNQFLTPGMGAYGTARSGTVETISYEEIDETGEIIYKTETVRTGTEINLAIGGLTERTLLHELIHAAVGHNFRKPVSTRQKAAVNQLEHIAEALRSILDKHAKGELTPIPEKISPTLIFYLNYAAGRTRVSNNKYIISSISTVEEIITVALSDPDIQDILKAMPPLGKVETSLWSEFVQGIRNLLGIPKKETTLLDQIVQASEVLMADEIDFVEDTAPINSLKEAVTRFKDILHDDGLIKDIDWKNNFNEVASLNKLARALGVLTEEDLDIVSPMDTVTIIDPETEEMTQVPSGKFAKMLGAVHKTLLKLDKSKEESTVFTNFIDQLQDRVKSIISLEELEKRKENFITGKEAGIHSNLEHYFGILGKFFYDLISTNTLQKGKTKTLGSNKDLEILKGINTLPVEAFVDEIELEYALVDLGIEKASAKELVKEYSRFERKYNLIYKDATDPQGNTAINHPLRILYASYPELKNEIDIPPQMKFAMMVGTLNWINQNPTNIRFRTGFDRELFMYGGHATLSIDEKAQLKPIGHDYNGAANSIGENINSLLRLFPGTDDAVAADVYHKNLIPALGMLALQVEHGPTSNSPTSLTTAKVRGIGKLKSSKIDQIWGDNKEDKPRFIIEQTKWQFKKINKEGRIREHGESYKHIKINLENKENEKDIPFKLPENLTNAHKDLTDTLKIELKGDTSKPAQKPFKEVVTRVKGFLGGVPLTVDNMLRKLHNVSWTNTEAFRIANVLDQAGFRDVLYGLADVQHIDDDTNLIRKESLETSNADKINAIDGLLAAYNDPEGNLLKEFYFKYELQNQHRIMQKSSGTVNPQGSGVDRYYVRPTNGSVKYTKKKLWKFKLAVVASFGFKIDKNNLEAALAAYDVLMENQDVLDAVNAIQSIKNTRLYDSSLSRDDRGPVEELAKLLPIIHNSNIIGQPDHGSSILQGLQGLAEGISLKSDIDERGSAFIVPTLKTSFSSDIILEIDGISNGFAQNVFQFPMYGDDNEKRRNQTGTTIGAIDSYDPYQTDAYEDLGTAAEKDAANSDTAEKFYKENNFGLQNKKWIYKPFGTFNKNGRFDHDKYNRINEALTRQYKPLAEGNTRKLLKYPFLIFMYGGGPSSIADGVASEIEAELYVSLEMLQREYNEQKGVTAQGKFIENAVQPFLTDLVTLEVVTLKDAKAIQGKIQSNTSKEVEFSTKGTDAIASVLLPRLNKALTSMLGGTQKAREAAVQAGELLHAVFLTHYNAAYDEMITIKENGRTILNKDGTPAKRPGLTEQEIEDLIELQLLEFFPQYKGPLMQEDGAFIDLTKRIRADIKNDAGRVTIDFNKVTNPDAKATATSKGIQFVEPGVSALIRMIINIDSSILTQTLANHPDVLPLHDAIMGSPDILEEASTDYNNLYLSINREFSVLNTIYERLEEVIQNTKLKDKQEGTNLMGAIEEWTLDNAFVNKNKKDKKKSFNKLVLDIKNNRNEILEAREAVEKEIEKAAQAGGGVFSQQLYMPKPDDALEDGLEEIEDKDSPASYSPILDPAIEHYLGDVPKPVNLDKSSLLTDEQVENIADSFRKDLNKNPKANEALGTVKDRKKVNPVKVLTGDLTKDNVMSLFKDMVNASSNYYASDADQNDHTAELESIISKIADKMTSATSIEFLQEEVDSITEGEFAPLANRLTVSLSTKPPKGLNAQSPQEVYVHETVHALVTAALAKSPLLKRRIEKLYQQTKKETSERGGYRRIFLQSIPGGRKATLTEHKIAKKQYDYIFNNPENEQWRLDEFLAFAVTNKNFVQYLSGTTSKIHLQYRKEEKLFNRALDVFTYFIEIATDIALRLFGERGGFGASSKTEMLAVLEKLLDIQGKHRNALQILQDKVAQTFDAGDTFLRTFAERKALDIMEEDPTTNKFKEAIRITTATGYNILSKNAQTLYSRQAVYETMGSVLRSLATEVGEGILGKRLIEQLLQSKVRISKARQETERFTTEWFNSIWKSVDATKPKGMSVDLRRNLTSVIFKTDLSSLLSMGYSHAKIASFIGDRNKIKLEKARIERQILNLTPVKNKNISWAVKYAEELGNHIVTGKTYLNLSHMNAFTIATNYIANPTNKELALLDAYATLTALGTLDDSKTSSVKSLVDNEFNVNATENGFIDLLDSHIQYVNKSYQDLFSNNRTQMVKGYIVERIDNLTDIKAGQIGQKREMAADGYHEPYSLGPIPGINKSNDTLFIGRNVPPVPYVSAIMSTTNKRHMGTSLSDILAQDPEYQISPNEPNFKKIKQAIKQIYQAQLEEAKSSKLATNPDLNLRPVRDDKDNITDFRIIMNHESKERLLDPDLEIQNVFAHMQSSYIDRKETLKNDLRTVELLVYEQEERFPSHPNEFIDFLDPEEGFIDRYYRLPKEVRMYIDQFSKNGKFMVRKDAINKVFGYQASDFRNVFFLQHPSMRHIKRFAGLFHYMLRQIVGYGKDRIVIAMPQVWLYNAFSNISQLTMRNIPLSYTVYKIIEGFHEYEAYSKAVDERRRLLNQIAIKKLDRTRSPEAVQVRALDTQIKNNRINRMSLWGLNSLIVEDLNDAALDGYATRARRYLKANEWYNRNDAVPNIAGPLVSSIFMMRNTGPYALMRKIVQLTDFLARYVMIEHGMEVRGMDFDTIAHESLDAFVLFDEALHPALEALDATGTTVFMSYFLRNQRASRKLAMSNPTGVLTSGAFQYSTGIPTLGNLDSSFLVGDISPNVMYLDELFDEANNPTGYDLLAQYLGDIFN